MDSTEYFLVQALRHYLHIESELLILYSLFPRFQFNSSQRLLKINIYCIFIHIIASLRFIFKYILQRHDIFQCPKDFKVFIDRLKTYCFAEEPVSLGR